jgi:hypothetical protein
MMLSLGQAFTVPSHPDVACFVDDREAGLIHVLPLTLSALSSSGLFEGQFTVFGSGPVERPAGVTAGFWMLRLAPPSVAADRTALARALDKGGTPVRLVAAEAGLSATVRLGDGITATRIADHWQGTALAFDGQVADAAAAALLAAWRAGLPDAEVTLDLAVTGSIGPSSFSQSVSHKALQFEPEATVAETRDTRLNVTLRRIDTRRLRVRSRLHGLTPKITRVSLMLSGFDP